jgi:hypothetical protein
MWLSACRDRVDGTIRATSHLMRAGLFHTIHPVVMAFQAFFASVPVLRVWKKTSGPGFVDSACKEGGLARKGAPRIRPRVWFPFAISLL